jgi:iron complex outermembrane recepter protein
MKTLNFLSFAGSSLLAVGVSAGAQAQAPAESTGFELEEIVVTARRREESLQDVPTTINAVTGADIEKLSIRRFEDIATVVPGLTMASNGNGIGATASVRGVNYDVNASGNNGTVEFYLNDAPISAGNLFQAVYDIQQVELLRGPQGTLRGRASPSGSMTVTTRRPDMSEFGGYASAAATDIGGYNGQGAISFPIISDKLAVRVAGLYDENEGNRVKSFNNSADPETETKSGRVTLSFQPIDSFSATFTYQLTQLDIVTNDQIESRQSVIPGSAPINSANNPLIGLVPPGTPLPPTFSAAPRTDITAEQRRSVLDRPRVIDNEFDNYNLQLQWAFAGQRLNYVGARNEQHLLSYEPQDVGDWFAPGAPAVYQGFGQDTDSVAEATAHELRLSNEERIGMFDYIVGAFYQKLDSPTDLTRVTPVFNPTAVPPAPSQFLNPTAIERRGDNHERSVFANLTAHLGDATEISGGVRYIEYEATGSLRVNTVLNPLANEDVEFDTTIWNVALSHKFTEDLMAYVNVGTSWRPGITAIGDFSLQLSPLETSFLILPPEESTSYEVGFKADFIENRLRTALSVYYQDFENYPYRSPSGVNFAEYPSPVPGSPPVLGRPFNFVAAVPVEVKGAELEVSFAATPNWDLGLTAAYAEGEIKDGFIPCNDYNPRDGIPDTLGLPASITGNPPAAGGPGQALVNANGGEHLAGCTVTQRSSNAPEWSGSLQTELRLPIGSAFDSFARAQVSLYGSTENDPTNTVDDYSGYELLNLYVGLRDQDGAWEVALYGKNVTETEEVLARSASTMSTPLNAGTQPTNYYGGSNTTGLIMTAPREFGVNLRYSFGSR